MAVGGLGWSLLLPQLLILLLVVSYLQQAHAQPQIPFPELEVDAASSITLPPVTTFLPDPELRHTLEELIEEGDDDPFTLKPNNETNTNNVTTLSTENPTAKVDNSSSTNSSSINSSSANATNASPSSEPPQVTTTSTEKEDLTVAPVTDKPSTTSPAPTSSSPQPPSEDINDALVSSSTENTFRPTYPTAILHPSITTKSNRVRVDPDAETISPSSYPVKKISPPYKKKGGAPAWVNKIARPIVFPVFLGVSWLFLGFLLACHLAVPKLRENTGTPFMFYIVALMLKATVTFCNIVFKHLHSVNFCFYAAAISYLKSLAMLFWVNIMVFDIWRKSRSLVKFKPAKSIAMWKYHLYGWGTPISLSLLSLLIELLVPDEASWIIKPGFDNGYKCWFEDDEAQLLYLNTPVGILHISNVILMVFTYRYVIRITDNAFVDDEPGAPGSTLPRDTAVPAAKRSDFISEFWFQFWILTYTVVQWVLWMIAQILQHFTGAWQLKIIPGFLIALQGLFLFIIFISNSGKRRVLKQQFPEIFEKINGCWSKVQKSQNKLSINKSSTSADIATEPQSAVGQTNPAFVEEENNVGQHGNIALANINQNQERIDS